uniref:Uncharacterized protein n=1 Tax=Avena sativa TaxID=4498 RepID=A0ACD5W7A0_AVESA
MSREKSPSMAEEEKVYVAVPAEPREGQSTLSWALGHLSGGGATTIVVTHVHVPPQTIPIMGVKFHVSKMGAEQVRQFRKVERQKADDMLDDYVRRCSEIKVKCEKLVIEKEDAVSGLVELIRLHGITKLVVAAAADRHYSKKLVKPVSRTATEIMQRADPSCKIWFVCKEQLICIRDNQAVQIAESASQLQEDETTETETGLLYDELQKAVEELMGRALKEFHRHQQAQEAAASSLQKAKAYEELYLEEVRKREELEAALARADGEIARLWRTFHRPTEGPETGGFDLGTTAWRGQPAEPW